MLPPRSRTKTSPTPLQSHPTRFDARRYQPLGELRQLRRLPIGWHLPAHLPAGQFLASEPPAAYDSVDAGGNCRWFELPVQEIPTLSGAMLLLLATALALMALRRLAR